MEFGSVAVGCIWAEHDWQIHQEYEAAVRYLDGEARFYDFHAYRSPWGLAQFAEGEG